MIYLNCVQVKEFVNGGKEFLSDPEKPPFGAFFDGIVRTEPFKDTGYQDFLDMFHDKKIKSIVIKDRRDADDQLRAGIEKTNRWAYEEKNSLKYQIKSLEHKVLNARKKFKAERILRKK